MKIQFLGAARAVTGSCHMMEVEGTRFAVDCGMHQGNAEIEKRNRENEHYDSENIDFFLVTHAHIDHSGLLPMMVKNGFKGPIYCTPPTRDLLEIMLLDSAHIQEQETEWRNNKRKRQHKKLEEPIYTQADAEKTFSLFKTVDYNEPFEPSPGISVTYKDAGHILGSAFLEVIAKDEGKDIRMIFSGDLGRPDQLLLRDPSKPEPADYLFVESTYGDRNHKNESTSREELAEAIRYSYENQEKVIIPAFAVERTQEVIYSLFLLSKEGKLPKDMPVYVDSPMAIRATEVFRKHSKYYDDQTTKLIKSGEHPLDLPNLKFTPRTDQSIALNTSREPAVIISASGMCNAGRIKHHLRHNLWRPGASVVFVGYQAMGTPGRRIVDGAKSIRIHGEDVAVRAKLFTIGGFSAHAGQSQILDWIEFFARPTMKVFLIHGEYEAQQTLAGLIKERFSLDVHIPTHLEECIIEAPEEFTVARPKLETVQPQVNWDFVLTRLSDNLGEIRTRMEEIKAKPWEYQTDYRDRLLEINGDILGLLSEI